MKPQSIAATGVVGPRRRPSTRTTTPSMAKSGPRTMRRRWKTCFALAALIVGSGSTAPARRIVPPIDAAPLSGDVLSVLTYNVKGLPWPVASGRAAALSAIAERLRLMRTQGHAPHVVVLQEAFTADAQAIGHAAGYRYIIDGPSVRNAPMESLNGVLSAGAHWWNGETEGKFVGSGLQLLSDYPVGGVRRLTFPESTCAGYDCLANKGALFVRIAVPGFATPVDIVTTHLNCRTASGVDDGRSDAAYAVQTDLMTRFVQQARDIRDPLIVAGDLNVGRTRTRRHALFGAIAARWGSVGDALGEAHRRGLAMSDDALASWHHAKDWQFFASGTAARIALTGIAVPFGHDAAGAMLSDHIGYVAYFRLSPIRTRDRSTA